MRKGLWTGLVDDEAKALRKGELAGASSRVKERAGDVIDGALRMDALVDVQGRCARL